MTPDELTARTRRWREARDLEWELRPQRDIDIRVALMEGMTQREAANAVGVSHSLPAHIAKGTNA